MSQLNSKDQHDLNARYEGLHIRWLAIKPSVPNVHRWLAYGRIYSKSRLIVISISDKFVKIRRSIDSLRVIGQQIKQDLDELEIQISDIEKSMVKLEREIESGRHLINLEEYRDEALLDPIDRMAEAARLAEIGCFVEAGKMEEAAYLVKRLTKSGPYGEKMPIWRKT